MQATEEDILDWIVLYLTEGLEIDIKEVEMQKTFQSYGFDSSAAVSMMGGLEQWLNLEIEPTLIFDYPTPETLAGYLASIN